MVILAGPTAAGKTKLSIAMAKAMNGEIISADSMQIYQHMDIGSAKITPAEMQGVPHHLIDVLDPKVDFNVVLFQKLAKQAMEQVYQKGKLPIIVGGTGFYIQAVLYDIDFEQSKEETSYRTMLEKLAEQKGAQYLHDMLRDCDPEAAESIHANNTKRVIRAIEYHHQTGQKISHHNEVQRQKEAAYEATYFVLTDVRERLYANIDQRVDNMLEQGLADEVKHLLDMGCQRESTAMQGLGYKEIIAYLKGECSLEEAVYLIKRDTRHFAKRQLTWFRREKEVIWLEKDKFAYDEGKMLQYIIEHCKTR